MASTADWSSACGSVGDPEWREPLGLAGPKVSTAGILSSESCMALAILACCSRTPALPEPTSTAPTRTIPLRTDATSAYTGERGPLSDSESYSCTIHTSSESMTRDLNSAKSAKVTTAAGSSAEAVAVAEAKAVAADRAASGRRRRRRRPAILSRCCSGFGIMKWLAAGWDGWTDTSGQTHTLVHQVR